MSVLHTGTGRVRLVWRLLLWLGLVVVFGGLLGALAIASGVEGRVGLVLRSGAELAGILLASWMVLRLDGRGLQALGFFRDGAAARESGVGLAVGVAAGAAVVALMALLGVVGWIADEGSVDGLLLVGALSLGFFVLPAAAEEALLRGYPLQALAEAWSPAGALLVTSVLFGLLHLPNPGITAVGVASIVAAGIFLGVLYLRTGSLWWATAAHVGWNWVHGYGADLPVSGLDLVDTPLFEGLTSGPAWLGGGAFGPEGSVLAVGVLLAASAAMWWGGWPNPSPAARAVRPLTPLPPEGRRPGGELAEAGEPEE